MTLCSAFIVVAYQADKTVAPRVGSTGGRPMVITENSKPGQMEREKTAVAEEKTKGIQARRVYRGFAYHAARFHDQSTISNRNRANAFCAGNSYWTAPARVSLTQNACGSRTWPRASTTRSRGTSGCPPRGSYRRTVRVRHAHAFCVRFTLAGPAPCWNPA